MRVTVAGAVFVAVVVALVAAVAVGAGTRGPLPTELEAVLVQLGEGPDGQPEVRVRDDGSGALLDVLDGATVAIVAHDQLICVGGSVTDATAGDPVSVSGLAEVRASSPPTLIADRVVVECGSA